MRAHRVHTSLALTPGKKVELEENAVRYLVQVLRLRPGAEITLFNGDGYEYPSRIELATKRQVLAEIREQSDKEAPPALSLHLSIGVSKGERMDFAIQKAVELGVSTITPLFTERSVVQLKGERLARRMDHWQKIMISACEQSGRRRLAEVREALPYNDWLAQREKRDGIMLDHRAEISLNQLDAPNNSVNLLVGPEGGLSDAERELAKAHGFQGVRLGPRVMRTETAPLAAIACIQMLWGDFR